MTEKKALGAQELRGLEIAIRSAKFRRQEFPIPCGLPEEIYPQLMEVIRAYAASLADSPSPTALTDEERDFYALLRGICEDVIDWLGTLSYDNVTDHRNILDHRLTKELNGKLQKMYKHPLDDKVLRRTDELEHLLRSPSGTAAETKEEN